MGLSGRLLGAFWRPRERLRSAWWASREASWGRLGGPGGYLGVSGRLLGALWWRAPGGFLGASGRRSGDKTRRCTAPRNKSCCCIFARFQSLRAASGSSPESLKRPSEGRLLTPLGASTARGRGGVQRARRKLFRAFWSEAASPLAGRRNLTQLAHIKSGHLEKAI